MSDGFRSRPVIPTASASVPYSAGLNARTRYSVSTAVNDAVLIWVASPNSAFRLIVSPRWGDSLGASRFIAWRLPVRARARGAPCPQRSKRKPWNVETLLALECLVVAAAPGADQAVAFESASDSVCSDGSSGYAGGKPPCLDRPSQRVAGGSMDRPRAIPFCGTPSRLAGGRAVHVESVAEDMRLVRVLVVVEALAELHARAREGVETRLRELLDIAFRPRAVRVQPHFQRPGVGEPLHGLHADPVIGWHRTQIPLGRADAARRHRRPLEMPVRVVERQTAVEAAAAGPVLLGLRERAVVRAVVGLRGDVEQLLVVQRHRRRNRVVLQ